VTVLNQLVIYHLMIILLITLTKHLSSQNLPELPADKTFDYQLNIGLFVSFLMQE
jgi:hypothetical protein